LQRKVRHERSACRSSRRRACSRAQGKSSSSLKRLRSSRGSRAIQVRQGAHGSCSPRLPREVGEFPARRLGRRSSQPLPRRRNNPALSLPPEIQGIARRTNQRGGVDVRLNRREEQGHCAPSLRHFIQPTRLLLRRALLVATVYPAQRTHCARTGGAVRARERRSRDNALRESPDFSERRLLDVAWSLFWSRRRNAELDRGGRGALGERCPR